MLYLPGGKNGRGGKGALACLLFMPFELVLEPLPLFIFPWGSF